MFKDKLIRMIFGGIFTFWPFMAVSTPAAPAITLTLKDAIFLALRYNPTVISDQFERVLQKFNLRLAEDVFEPHYALTGSISDTVANGDNSMSHSVMANINPEVSLETGLGTQLSLSAINSTAFNSQYYNPQITLKISQPLLQGANPNVVLAPLHNAYDQERINLLNYRNSVIDQVVEVINSYRAVVNIEQSLKIERVALKRACENYRVIQQLIKAGQRPSMDLAQAIISINQNRLVIIQEKASLAQAKQQLLLIIGVNPAINYIIPSKVTLPKFRLPNEKISIELALKNNSAYQSDLLRLKIARRNLWMARDQQNWQLNVNASAGWGISTANISRSKMHDTRYGSFGLSLNIPIHDLQSKQQTISAETSLKQLQIQILFDKRLLISSVENVLRNLKTAMMALKVSEEVYHLQKITLQNTYLQYRAGQTSSLAVSQQQNALTYCALNVLAGKIQWLNAITAYYQLLQLTLKQWHIKLRY